MEISCHNWLYYRDDGFYAEVKTEAVTLDSILEDFKYYLSACGYCIAPTEHLIIVDEEEPFE